MKFQIAGLFISLILLCTALHADIIESFGSGSNQFNMSFVPIGNPGNAPDRTGSPNLVGSVGYHYRIGKYEVSRDMIIKANAAGSLGVTLADMTFYGGNGVDRPATGISWNEAARYVNWLNTSRGYSPAYKFATQPGQAGYDSNSHLRRWSSTDPGYNAANRYRNSLAHYFLPNWNEWYKAAYYDPNANGGAGSYWNFPTGSDIVPTAVSGGTAEGTAVYDQPTSQGPADFTNAGGLSPYGAMGMAGNAWEWEETEFDLVNDAPAASRGVRGGSLNSFAFFLSAEFRSEAFPEVEYFDFGFRVASIPEPSSAALLILSCLGLLQRSRRAG